MEKSDPYVMESLKRIELKLAALEKVVKDIKNDQDNTIDASAALQAAGINSKLETILSLLAAEAN